MDPSRVRRRVALAGAAATVAYVVSATVSGTLSPLARRPLLDGTHSAPPYNWVQAPEGEQGSGEPAASASQRLPLAEAGNAQASVATADSQAVLALPAGAIDRAPGRTTAEVKIEPLDAATAVPPEGYRLRSNVYRVAIRSVPGGQGIPTVDPAGTLTMTYAAPTLDLITARHDLMFSSDGTDWRLLGAQEQHATQQVSAPFVDIGYFAAVAQIPDEDEPGDKGGGFPWLVVIVVLVAAGAVFATVTRIRRARARARQREEMRRQLARQSRSTKKKRRR